MSSIVNHVISCPSVVNRQPRHSMSICRQSSNTSFHVHLLLVVNHVIPCPSVVSRQTLHSMSICRQSSTTSFHVHLSSVINHVIPCPSVVRRQSRQSHSRSHGYSCCLIHTFSLGSPRPQQHSPNSRPSGMTGI